MQTELRWICNGQHPGNPAYQLTKCNACHHSLLCPDGVVPSLDSSTCTGKGYQRKCRAPTLSTSTPFKISFHSRQSFSGLLWPRSFNSGAVIRKDLAMLWSAVLNGISSCCNVLHRPLVVGVVHLRVLVNHIIVIATGAPQVPVVVTHFDSLSRSGSRGRSLLCLWTAQRTKTARRCYCCCCCSVRGAKTER